MPEWRVNAATDLKWDLMRDLYPAEMQVTMGQAELDSAMTTHEQGADSSPHLEELRFLPGAEVKPHAHDMAEIIYVLEGSLHFGNRELEPGSSAYIGEDTLYSFKAGSKGARLLIFMASGNARYFSKDDFTARAKLDRQATADG